MSTAPPRPPVASSSSATTNVRKPSQNTHSTTLKQRLLCSRDKAPLITPRQQSTSTSTRSIQSTLSAKSFVAGNRKPLAEKSLNRFTTTSNERKPSRREHSQTCMGTSNVKGKTRALEEEREHVGHPSASSQQRNRHPGGPNNSKLKRHRQGRDSHSQRSATSIARQIFDPAKTRRRSGPTIEFDGPDLPADDDEMRDESQRCKRRRQDRGGFGKLDLVNAEDLEDEEPHLDRGTGRPSMRTQEVLELSSSDAEETKQTSHKPHKSKPSSYHLARIPPRQSPSLRSQRRSKSISVCSPHSSESTGSAGDIQALLVPGKKPARILVPDSDPLEPAVEDDDDETPCLEEPETEADDDSTFGLDPVDKTVQARYDDSGFVEFLDLSYSSSPPVKRQHSDDSGRITEDLFDEDDEEHEEEEEPSVPDSQALPLHLSSELGSSSPVKVVKHTSNRKLPSLKPSESSILMPPPLKRLRRGAPPRPQVASPSSSPRRRKPGRSSKILVEDTQYRSPHRKNTINLNLSSPNRVFCEETQYPDDEAEQEEEELSIIGQQQREYWSRVGIKLPSDLPVLDSDQITLPSPKPLRPLKELIQPIPSISVETRALEPMAVQIPAPEVMADPSMNEPEVHAWDSLRSAWQGSKALSPPRPPQPRQSRLTEHFSIDSTTNRVVDLGGRETLVENSQLEEDAVSWALGRAVRDSIEGLKQYDMNSIEHNKLDDLQRIIEEDNICSSPLSSLAPSECDDRELEARRDETDHVKTMTVENDDYVVSDSEDEGETGSGYGAKTRFSPLGTTSSSGNAEVEIIDFARRSEIEHDEERKSQDRPEAEETLWESYWTFGTPPTPRASVTNQQDGLELPLSKTVAEMLLDEADFDLPAGWSETRDGEWVKSGF